MLSHWMWTMHTVLGHVYYFSPEIHFLSCKWPIVEKKILGNCCKLGIFMTDKWNEYVHWDVLLSIALLTTGQLKFRLSALAACFPVGPSNSNCVWWIAELSALGWVCMMLVLRSVMSKIASRPACLVLLENPLRLRSSEAVMSLEWKFFTMALQIQEATDVGIIATSSSLFSTWACAIWRR